MDTRYGDLLAAAREYYMLDVLSHEDRMSDDGMMRVMDIGAEGYRILSSILHSEGCIIPEDGFVSISDKGRIFADSVPLFRVAVLPDWSLYGDFRSGIVLEPPRELSASCLNDMALSMGADGAELFRVESGYIFRESVSGTAVLNPGVSRKMRFMTGLGRGEVLVSVHSSSKGTANIVSAALGIGGLLDDTIAGP